MSTKSRYAQTKIQKEARILAKQSGRKYIDCLTELQSQNNSSYLITSDAKVFVPGWTLSEYINDFSAFNKLLKGVVSDNEVRANIVNSIIEFLTNTELKNARWEIDPAKYLTEYFNTDSASLVEVLTANDYPVTKWQLTQIEKLVLNHLNQGYVNYIIAKFKFEKLNIDMEVAKVNLALTSISDLVLR